MGQKWDRNGTKVGFGLDLFGMKIGDGFVRIIASSAEAVCGG